MKRVSSTIQEAEINIIPNAKSASYQVSNHEKYENLNLPVNLNILKFVQSTKNERLTKILYQDSETGIPSTEFKTNLIYFYIYFLVYIISLGGFASLLHDVNHLSMNHLVIHVICLVIIGIFAISILILLFRSTKVLLNSRNFFLIITCCMNFYLIFADERILHKLTGEDYNENRLPLSLGLICNIVMARIILFDYFLYIFILGISTCVIFLTTHLALSGYSSYSVLSEASIIGLFSLIQIIECYRADYRIKQIFWRREQEAVEENSDNSKNDLYKIPGINTESESVLLKCDNISSNLKQISRVVIYKDIKRLLKKSLNDIDSIKRKVAHGDFDTAHIQLNPALDDEDREFITQNFMELSSVRCNLQQGTLSELNERINSFPFSRYGVTELESVLSSLGKNWNFDIFFVYDSTGHSISMVSKYLMQKWSISENSNIPEKSATKYFQELENVYFI